MAEFCEDSFSEMDIDIDIDIDTDTNTMHKLMTRSLNLIINNKLSECIRIHEESISTSINTVIMYSGLCKTKQIIKDLQLNDINCVIAYNKKEVEILASSNMDYVLKIKLSNDDIGINKDTLTDIVEECDDNVLKHIRGLYITIFKKHMIGTFNVIDILNVLLRNCNIGLKYVILDIIEEHNERDVMNQSNISFKMSIYNYIKARINDCSVF